MQILFAHTDAKVVERYRPYIEEFHACVTRQDSFAGFWQGLSSRQFDVAIIDTELLAQLSSLRELDECSGSLKPLAELSREMRLSSYRLRIFTLSEMSNLTKTPVIVFVDGCLADFPMLSGVDRLGLRFVDECEHGCPVDPTQAQTDNYGFMHKLMAVAIETWSPRLFR